MGYPQADKAVDDIIRGRYAFKEWVRKRPFYWWLMPRKYERLRVIELEKLHQVIMNASQVYEHVHQSAELRRAINVAETLFKEHWPKGKPFTPNPQTLEKG